MRYDFVHPYISETSKNVFILKYLQIKICNFLRLISEKIMKIHEKLIIMCEVLNTVYNKEKQHKKLLQKILTKILKIIIISENSDYLGTCSEEFYLFKYSARRTFEYFQKNSCNS